MKNVLLKDLRNSQENTCAGVSLFLETVLISNYTIDVNFATFFRTLILQNTWEQLLLIIDVFLEVFRKFQKIFKSTNEKMFLVYIVPYCDSEGKLTPTV